MHQGREVIDIGPDFQRRAATGGRSSAYEMERRNLRGYEGYRKAFERLGNTRGCRLLTTNGVKKELSEFVAEELSVIEKHGFLPPSIQGDDWTMIFLISKEFQLICHAGMDCRHPEHMDVIGPHRPWPLGSGNPCRNDYLVGC